MKARPVKIDENVYIEVKKYCNENALKISRWISKILMEKLNEKANMDTKMPNHK